ncbi:MAG: hypothetical protein B6D37_03810 [Sphingobacteriales bacterium UTBCD1]|jgi:signal transduction histidine kinase|nr:MAG: hypothetical protein B6D37_03810 [Sphingobacteriales bacterium UTBCD1]
MLNGISIDFSVTLLVTGAVLMVSIYHTVLYIQRRSRLLALYSIYLWPTFLYCFFRVISPVIDPKENSFVRINLDEILPMVSFIMYIRFMAFAMSLDRIKDKYSFLFVRITPYVILGYLVINSTLLHSNYENIELYGLLRMVPRLYLLLLGSLLLIIVLQRRKTPFFRYIGAGAASMLLFGLISFLINVFFPGTFMMGAISWLMFGYFTDIIFFSAAIGYQIRKEYEEKEKSLQWIIQKDAEIKEKELDKMRAIIETREKERDRIAQDLHDEVGATLSSIHIFSSVASKIMARDPQRTLEILQHINQSTFKVMETMSDLVWAIHTNNAREASLEGKLKNYGYEFLTPVNINCVYQIDKEAEKRLVNIEAKKDILRIAREAMNNMAKYSEATNALVKLSLSEEFLQLLITDNGKGFYHQEISSGHGLSNMKKRTETLGGLFSVKSTEGCGTAIQCNIPITSISE